MAAPHMWIAPPLFSGLQLSSLVNHLDPFAPLVLNASQGAKSPSTNPALHPSPYIFFSEYPYCYTNGKGFPLVVLNVIDWMRIAAFY